MKKYLIFFFIIIMGYGCDILLFEPNDEPYSEVNKPTTNISIDLVNVKDTIKAANITQVNYSIDFKEKQKHSILFFVDTTLIGDYVYYNNQVVNIDTRQFSDGLHNLKVIAVAKSSGRSLAAILQSEFVFLERNYPILIHNSIPTEPFKINSILTSKDGVKIKWDKFNYANFDHYELNVEYFDIKTGYWYGYKEKVTDAEINEYVDELYSGGEVRYTVNLSTKNGLVQGEEYQFEDKPSSIIATETITDSTLAVKWNKCKYPKYFTRYEIFDTYLDKTLEIIENINDTTKTIPLYFGNKKHLKMITVKTSDKYTIKSHSEGEIVFQGNETVGYSKLQVVPELNSIYLDGHKTTHRLDINTFEVLATYDGNVNISPDGKLAFGYGLEISVPTLEKAYEIDPLTLENKSKIVLEQFPNAIILPLNDRKTLVNGYTSVEGKRGFSIVELDNKTIIDEKFNLEKYKYEGYYFVNIAQDGKTFFGHISRNDGDKKSQTGVYYLESEKLNRGACWNAHWNLYAVDEGFFAFTKDSESIMRLYQNEITVWDCKTGEIKKVFNPEFICSNITVDKITGNIGLRGAYGDYYIYTEEFKRIKKIKTSNIYNPKLVNSTLFSGVGTYIKLDL